MPVYILMEERKKSVDLGEWERGYNLGVVGRAKIIIRIYCLKKNPIS